MLCHVLVEEGERIWLAFRRPVDELPSVRFSTHYMVCSGSQAVLIDPGGPGDFGPLLAAVTEKIALERIDGIVITHPAAHVSGSVGLWSEVLGHNVPVYASELVSPDLGHVDPDMNVVAVPESGGEVPMADGSGLHIIPAPYLPNVASTSIYDPVGRVLYSGDIGTAEGQWAEDATPFAEKFALVGHAMNAFHETWFASNSAKADWLERIGELDVDIIAPRAGPCFKGKNVEHFTNWLASMHFGALVEKSDPSFLDSHQDYAPNGRAHDEGVYDAEPVSPAVEPSPAAEPEPPIDLPDIPDAVVPTSELPEMAMAPEDDRSDEQRDIDEGEEIYGRLMAERQAAIAEAEAAGAPIPADDEAVESDAEPAPEPEPYAHADEDDDEVSRLVDALEDTEVEDSGADEEPVGGEDFEIVYVDEEGNEIDPNEIDDADLLDEEEAIEGNDEIRLEFPPGKMFRLITRSDFDGLVCAVLLEELDLINDILFVHPNQMQEGEIPVSEDDISTNLPYTPGIFAAFDHHLSEIKRVGTHYDNHIIDPLAPSAARVVYNYFGAEKRFPDISKDMMDAVDKGDAAQFNEDEVLNAQGWPLLNFIMDSRTGLGRFRGFRVPNYELMMSLIDYCRRYDIDEILEHPDVKERVDLYREHEEQAKEQIKRCTTVHGNLAVLDYRNEENIFVVNRFMIYALFPECNISMHVMWGRAQQNTVFAVGKSIFNKTSNTNIGELMLTYGGGGHRNAGTCQSDNALADVVRDALIQRINADG